MDDLSATLSSMCFKSKSIAFIYGGLISFDIKKEKKEIYFDLSSDLTRYKEAIYHDSSKQQLVGIFLSHYLNRPFCFVHILSTVERLGDVYIYITDEDLLYGNGIESDIWKRLTALQVSIGILNLFIRKKVLCPPNVDWRNYCSHALDLGFAKKCDVNVRDQLIKKALEKDIIPRLTSLSENDGISNICEHLREIYSKPLYLHDTFSDVKKGNHVKRVCSIC
jgi:hypothetical protein